MGVPEFVGKSGEQLGAFSREIATWICNQEGPFSSEDLTEMMMSTKRPFDQNLLLKVANDVNDTVNSINEMSTFPRKILDSQIGTRTSNLTMWQANKVQDMLNSEGLETEIIGLLRKVTNHLAATYRLQLANLFILWIRI